jgi:hypothetical protein
MRATRNQATGSPGNGTVTASGVSAKAGSCAFVVAMLVWLSCAFVVA